jgi:signal peptidase I
MNAETTTKTGKPVASGRCEKPSLSKQLLQCAVAVLVAYGSFLLFSQFGFLPVRVVGPSMSPTLHDADFYFLNRWVYVLHDPQPKDIVVLRDPQVNGYAVKRVIARAGDTVVLNGGHLYVNGQELEEPYLTPGTPTFTNPKHKEQTIVCGTDQYFVLGDNRRNSADSRDYGLVPRQNILGLITH